MDTEGAAPATVADTVGIGVVDGVIAVTVEETGAAVVVGTGVGDLSAGDVAGVGEEPVVSGFVLDTGVGEGAEVDRFAGGVGVGAAGVGVCGFDAGGTGVGV